MKKYPGDIISLHMCTNNYDSMMYDSRDMVRERQDKQTETDRKGYIKRWVLHIKREDLLTKNIFEKGLISKHI